MNWWWGFLIGFGFLDVFCLALALGMMLMVGKRQIIIDRQTSLLMQLHQYAIDESWKESLIHDRQRWLRSDRSGIRFAPVGQLTLFGYLPDDRDLLVGPRVDDFFRWKARRQNLEAMDKQGRGVIDLKALH